MLGRVWCCVRAKASTFSNMWCRAWFDSSVQSCAGRRMHQRCTQSHIVAAVGGHHESSHRVGILSVSSCVRCGVVVIAFNGHVDVRDLLFFRSQDVWLKIDLWHPVLFRQAFRAVFYPEPCCRAHRNRSSVSKTKDGDVTVWYLQLHGTATQRAFVAGNLYPRGHYL